MRFVKRARQQYCPPLPSERAPSGARPKGGDALLLSGVAPARTDQQRYTQTWHLVFASQLAVTIVRSGNRQPANRHYSIVPSAPLWGDRRAALKSQRGTRPSSAGGATARRSGEQSGRTSAPIHITERQLPCLTLVQTMVLEPRAASPCRVRRPAPAGPALRHAPAPAPRRRANAQARENLNAFL